MKIMNAMYRSVLWPKVNLILSNTLTRAVISLLRALCCQDNYISGNVTQVPGQDGFQNISSVVTMVRILARLQIRVIRDSHGLPQAFSGQIHELQFLEIRHHRPHPIPHLLITHRNIPFPPMPQRNKPHGLNA